MNVTKTEKGYAISINEDTTIELDYAAAMALSEFIDKESYKEDVKLAVDREYDEGTADKLPDDLLIRQGIQFEAEIPFSAVR